ncbi:hypothetical protein H2198_000879 [Neophaeococcomyces mojaviensis]|uniref:Uncharacterized protein n=1 Tax=Neophaeococcomyces mojaviensis TaxID=3383035 RepID=A0ACC3AJ63_9EURO|nr:hypothetical protein H2198_000879 [Knufia sp. JES_112]
MDTLGPFLSSDKTGRNSSHSNGSTRYIHTGTGAQKIINNSGYIGEYSGSGNPTFNFGPVLPGRTNFTGAYAHSSLHSVATYVPRPELEQQLQAQLSASADPQQSKEPRTVVIWGLGGAGKSQLALRYVQKHQQDYQAVFWIEAGRKETIERDYVQIYKQLYPSLSSSNATMPVEDAITGVNSWLQGQDKRCLWVMDSADEVEDDTSELYVDLNHYLPNAPQLDRIVTTRSSRVQGMNSQGAIEVKEMTEPEAVDLFRRCANLLAKSKHDEQEVLKIVKELGCLALAVTLAGSYVREDPEMSSDLSLYLLAFQQRRAQLLSQKPHRLVYQYGESVLSTWEISYSTIQRQSPAAAKLLNVLAFLNFDDIFLNLFVERPTIPTRQQLSLQDHNIATIAEKPRWVQILSSNGASVNHDSIKSAFKTLHAYSLVSWRSDQQAYRMHKLVHAWGHDRLSVEQGRAWSSAALELLCDRQGDVNIERRLVPHVMANFIAVSSAYEGDHQVSAEDRNGLSWVVRLLHRLGRWDDEYRVRVFLREVMEATLGLEHPDTLTSMNDLALVLSNQGKYEQAEEMHGQTLEVQKKVLGHEHPDTLTSMNNLALVLSRQGKYEQAEEMHGQTLEVQKKVLGHEHLTTLASMNNPAAVLSRQGKYERAKEMYRQTLELMKRVQGLEHSDILWSVGGLATVLRDQDKYKQAEEMYRQILELQKVLGHEHPVTLTSMNNLALVLSRQGKYEQAEEMHGQTLEVQKKVLGHEHPDTLTSMNSLNVVRISKNVSIIVRKTMRTIAIVGLLWLVLGTVW